MKSQRPKIYMETQRTFDRKSDTLQLPDLGGLNFQEFTVIQATLLNPD